MDELRDGSAPVDGALRYACRDRLRIEPDRVNTHASGRLEALGAEQRSGCSDRRNLGGGLRRVAEFGPREATSRAPRGVPLCNHVHFRADRASQYAAAAIRAGIPTRLVARRKLYARAVRLNSPRTFSSRRIRKVSCSIQCLIDPKGCSTHSRRWSSISGPGRQAARHPVHHRLVLVT